MTSRTLAWLSVPPLAFALFVAYLHARIPGYEGVAAAHRVFWDAQLTWPFATLVEYVERARWGTLDSAFALTCTWVGIYLLSIALGLRPSERPRWFLALWVASIVLFHVSLDGLIGAADFQRLVLLAWPAALLILWRSWGRRLPAVAVALALAGLAVFGGSDDGTHHHGSRDAADRETALPGKVDPAPPLRLSALARLP